MPILSRSNRIEQKRGAPQKRTTPQPTPASPASFRLCSVSPPTVAVTGRSCQSQRPTAPDPRAVPQSQPLTFMPVGHLLAAGKVQAHQGAEAEEEGEVEHEEHVLHHREAPATRRPPRAASARSRIAGFHLQASEAWGAGSASSLPKRSLSLCFAGFRRLLCFGRRALSTGRRLQGRRGWGAPVTRTASALAYSLRAFLPDARLPEPPSCRCPGPWTIARAPGSSASNGDAVRAFSRTRPQRGGAARLCQAASLLLASRHPRSLDARLGSSALLPAAICFTDYPDRNRPLSTKSCNRSRIQHLRTWASVSLAFAREPSLAKASKVKMNRFYHKK